MKHALPLVAYLIVAVIFTWPVASQMETTVTDPGDPLHLSWILDWNISALTHTPWRIFSPPVFHPSKYPLAYSENLIGVAAAVLPFSLLGLGPIAVYNVALLLGLALSAWAGYFLGWTMTRRFVPSLVAGLLYGFVPYKIEHLQHLQIVWGPCVALLLAAIIRYGRMPSMGNAALLAASLAANVLLNLYYFLYGAVILGLSLVLIALAERRDARFWLRLAAALAVAGIAVIPILRPYWIVSKMYGMERNTGEALGGSATPVDWLLTGGRNVLYGRIIDPHLWPGEERTLFPGLVFVALAMFGIAAGERRLESGGERRRTPTLDAIILVVAIATYFAFVADRVKISWHGRTLLAYRGTTNVTLLLVVLILVRFTMRGSVRRALQRYPLEMSIAALWIGIGFVGSLGLHTPFHTFLFESVPGFRATRVAARWAVVSYAGLAVWAAYGVAAAASAAGARSRRGHIVLAMIVALALLDLWPRIRWMHVSVEVSQVDQWIARERAGPVYLLPFTAGDYATILRATVHHQRMFNGLSSFEPPLYRDLATHSYEAHTLDVLQKYGCRFVIVRPEWCGWQIVPIFGWLRKEIAQGRLAFVRRFDYNAGGDWVFAVTRNERSWQRWRVAEGPDQELARFLNGQPTRSGITFGRMSTPTQYSQIRGALDITGLAMSPYGIRSVTARIDNGRYRVPLPLFEREDFTRQFPWYPQSPRPAFSLRIERRPKEVPKDTDVQVEIVDGHGGVTMLPDAPIAWN